MLFSSAGSGVSMAFTAIQLAVNDVSPGPRSLGTLNALSLALTSGTRAISPALFASIYAFGVREQILWGQLVWVVLVAVALALWVALRWLPQKAEGIVERERASGSEE